MMHKDKTNGGTRKFVAHIYALSLCSYLSLTFYLANGWCSFCLHLFGLSKLWQMLMETIRKPQIFCMRWVWLLICCIFLFTWELMEVTFYTSSLITSSRLLWLYSHSSNSPFWNINIGNQGSFYLKVLSIQFQFLQNHQLHISMKWTLKNVQPCPTIVI